MTNVYNEDFKNSTKCWICENDYVDNDVRLRDHYHMSGNYGGSAHRGCNINLKLNQKNSCRISTQKIMIPILLCRNEASSILKWIRKIYELYYQ